MCLNSFLLEGLNKGIEIGDRETDVMTSGKILGIGEGCGGAPGTFWKLGARVPFNEVEIERGRQFQPYDVEFKFRAFYLFKPKYLLVELSETVYVG